MVIPSSLLGVALLIVLSVPGWRTYSGTSGLFPLTRMRRSRSAPRCLRHYGLPKRSVAALVAAGPRWFLPSQMPNFCGLVQHPSSFAREHYVQLAWRTLALIVLATILGAVVADPRIVRIQRPVARTRVCRPLSGSTDARISPVSAWYRSAWYRLVQSRASVRRQSRSDLRGRSTG